MMRNKKKRLRQTSQLKLTSKTINQIILDISSNLTLCKHSYYNKIKALILKKQIRADKSV